MPTPSFLADLLSAAGPSGHESAPAEVWRAFVAPFAAEVRRDVLGSTMARVPGRADGPTVALLGHIDEIGLHVTHIDDDGGLRFDAIGGWDPVQLVGQRVEILTRSGLLAGAIGRKPVHMLQSSESEQAPKLTDLRIDIGARDAADAGAHVRVGDAAVVGVQPLEVLNDRVVSRALDNRIGAYVVAEAARLIAEAGGGAGDVWALATAQEEIGLNGAGTSVFGLAPTVIVVVDTTPATDQHDVEIGVMTDHDLGAGPVIARGITLHPALSEQLIDTAEREGIGHLVESLGANTGAEPDEVAFSRAGIATALVSVTIRYMHSPVEMAALPDIDATARLLAAFVLSLDPDLDLTR